MTGRRMGTTSTGVVLRVAFAKPRSTRRELSDLRFLAGQYDRVLDHCEKMLTYMRARSVFGCADQSLLEEMVELFERGLRGPLLIREQERKRNGAPPAYTRDEPSA